MPIYQYYCKSNGRKVSVFHPMAVELKDWGELCYVAQLSLGDTDPAAPVVRQIGTPYVHVATGPSQLKELGFTKLVRRDAGVYENVTALDGESRYFKAGKKSTAPHLHKKIRD